MEVGAGEGGGRGDAERRKKEAGTLNRCLLTVTIFVKALGFLHQVAS